MTFDPLNPEADEALAKEAADLRRAGAFPHPQSPKGMQLRQAEVRVRSAHNPGQPVQGRGLPDGITTVHPDGRAEVSPRPQSADVSAILPDALLAKSVAGTPDEPIAKAVAAQDATARALRGALPDALAGGGRIAQLRKAFEELTRLRERRAATALAKGVDPGSFTITRKG